MLSFPDALARAILDRLAAAAPGVADAGKFKGATMKLFKADLTISRSTTLAQLEAEECDFTGYAESAAITWGTAITDDDGNTRLIGDTKQFTCSGTAVSNTVYGYYVLDSAGTGLLWAEKFATPRVMDVAGEGIPVVPVFELKR